MFLINRVYVATVCFFLSINFIYANSVNVGYDDKNKEIYNILGSRSFTISIKDLLEQFKKDVPSIVSKTDKTIITGYTQSENLSASFKNYTIKALEEVAVDNKPSLNIIQCLECLSLRVEVIRGQNHVKKGITNLEELNNFLKQYSSNSYTEINLAYVGSSLVLQITIYSGVERTILFSKKYQSKVYSLKEEGLIFGLSGVVSTFIKRSNLGPSFGGKLYLGHRMPSIGEVGTYASLVSISNNQTQANAGMFLDLDMNDILKNIGHLVFFI